MAVMRRIKRTRSAAAPKSPKEHVISMSASEQAAYQRALRKMACEKAMENGDNPLQIIGRKPLWQYYLPLEVRTYFDIPMRLKEKN